MAKTANIDKLRQEAVSLAKKQKEILARIKKKEQEEKEKRYVTVGKEMEKIFKKDPECSDTKSILALCRKNFAYPVKKTSEAVPEETPVSNK
jgi:hypothetical protein